MFYGAHGSEQKTFNSLQLAMAVINLSAEAECSIIQVQEDPESGETLQFFYIFF